MADHTVPGIIGIVAIVLIFAVFLSPMPEAPESSQQPQMTETLAGQAVQPQAQEPGQISESSACKPSAFCDGSKLTMIRDDCSVNYAYCQYGCQDARCR